MDREWARYAAQLMARNGRTVEVWLEFDEWTIVVLDDGGRLVPAGFMGLRVRRG